MNTPKWLVMVYMQAGDNSQLDSLAVQDLLEMQEGVRKSPEVEVLVEIQRKWPSERQRYRLRCNESPDEPAVVSFAERQPPTTNADGKPIDMGSREALADFLTNGFQLEAQYYCLVLWGHAFGLGFGRFNHNPLTLEELRLALGDGGRRLDVLATNACTMSYIEAAYQLNERVHYLVASQAFVPLTGLPYKRILRGIRRETEPLDLSKMIVDRYLGDFSDSRSGEGNAGRDEKVAMTVLDLDDRREVGEHLDRLAVAITNLIGAPDATGFDPLDEIRDVFLANPAGDVRPVIDLYSLTNDLIDLCDDRATTYRTGQPGEPGPVEDLRDAAKKLGEAVRPPANIEDDNRDLSSVLPNGSIVVYHREHPDLEGMSGVGIFAPFVVNKSFLKELELDDKKGKAAYKNLLIFGGDRSNWVSLVYEDLRMDNDVLDEVVDASGVVRPAQRIQVNQLVRAVDAAFNRLDRTLRRTEARIVKELQWKRESKALPAPDALGTFGPPHLKLAGDLSLLDPAAYVEPGLVPPGPPHESELDPVVKALGKIERAVELVEKTTRRVITNRTFGLGPPSSRADGMQLPIHLGPKPSGGEFGPKPSGGEFGPKPSGGEFGPKPSGGEFGPKPSGGEFGPKPSGGEFGLETGALLSSDPQVAGLAVCTLIGLVASSLVDLERATAGVEAMAAQFLFMPKFGAMLSSRDYTATVEQRCQDAFGLLTEAALEARRTIRRVLAHPVYGLGPGPQGLGQAERDALATSAGLNRRNLALLSARGVPTPGGVVATI